MGHAVTIGMFVIYIFTVVLLWATYRNENQARKARKQDWKVIYLTDEEIKELGDKSPRFVYAT